ncbi:hypothetical protein KL938_001626 [Ogataea parapolymorpha]|nr:hypothetical protein KL938_001626 [Ogataea parapolymorpha]
MSAAAILQKELKELTKSQPSFRIELDLDNIFLWDIGMYIPNPHSKYNGAYLKCQMRFPSNYPFSPPAFRFTPPIFHPNVYKDGRVCISILHEAGDAFSGEPSNETWSPAQCVESVLVSIISLLDDPNINSPANVDASKMFRDHKEDYYNMVAKDVERSKKDIPDDFEIPDATSRSEADDYEDEWFYQDDDEDDDEIDEDDQSFIDDEEVEMSEDYGEDTSK